MAGIALKGQCDLVSIMVPPKVSKKETLHRRNKNFEDVTILLICVFVDLLNTETGVRGSMLSIVHIYVIFLSLYVLEEMFFYLVFKCVDVVRGFQVRCETVPYFWHLVIETFLACFTLTKRDV